MAEKFIVETSARHVHVTQADLETLFGAGYTLHVKKELSQPGQFASEERVDLVGPKKTLAGVSILGPVRPASQVEVSLSDARVLGTSAPVRESGDTTGSAPIKLVGPKGEIELKEGLIVAKRHIHLTPQSAAQMHVADKQIVKVRMQTEGRSLVFDDVVCRVNSSFATAMHIDTDEANAAACAGEVWGELA